MTTTTKAPLRIAIIGASGKVSRHVITQLRARGDDVVAIFRNGDRADDIAKLGATPVVLDIEQATGAALAETIAGSDAVLFSAGAGGGDADRTRAVDFDGAVLAMAAASAANVKRFIMVSAMGAGGPVPTEGDMVTYYRAKHDADEALMATDLDWTILRPGALTDDAATGLVSIANNVERGSVPRSDVAAVIIAALDDPRSIGVAWELASGSQSISDAINSQV